MNDSPRQSDGNGASSLAAGIRLDLLIALCALLISVIATAATWWQVRVLQAQTAVLQEQLGAQVWPYVSISEGINNDTVQVTIGNDGLGPAVLRNASATVDGKVQHSFIDVMHAILGPHIVSRARKGERISLSLSDASPGSVVRAGDSTVVFSLKSKRYAAKFLTASTRMSFHLCYCAIIPGKCWQDADAFTREPRPVTSCPEVPGDLLHASSVKVLTTRDF
jgi:hypothetical protein